MSKAKFIKKYSGLLFLAIAGLLMFWLFSEDNADAVVDETVNSDNSLPRVAALAVSPQKILVPIASQGNIRARWRSVLTGDIAGKVTYVSPQLLMGGEFNQGDVLLRVDDTRYRVELAEAQSALAIAEQLHAQERLQAKRAAQEWKLSGLSGQASDLLLRKPQLKATSLQVKAAQATVKLAKKNLSVVAVVAPYAGATISRRISLGDYLAPEAEIAEIYARRQLQVHLPLKPSQLPLLSNEANVVLRAVDGKQQWRAKIVRQSKVVDPKSRMVTMIAELDDDIPLEALPLLGQFVEAELSGQLDKSVLQVPKSCLSGDSRVWLVDSDSTLKLLDHKYLSEHGQSVYLKPLIQSSSGVFNIVCYPSKAFFVGMSVAMQLKNDE